ncbi:MAG TPA: SprT family zinc-dependent metalloprotease [Patescibacteria group bacterium]
MDSIVLDGRTFFFEIHPKSIRSLNLKITSSHTFDVTCPRFTPAFVIKKFILDNQSWILRHAIKVQSKPSLLNLTEIPLLGIPYKLIYSQTAHDSVIISDDDHLIRVNTTAFSESHVKKILSLRLKKLAAPYINKELKSLSLKFGFHYARVTLRNQRSRFGSCSTRKNLNFNWQIILFPENVFRHVLLHELTHLEHMNHSVRFWSSLASYDPDWKSNNRWLKTQGNKHLIFS